MNGKCGLGITGALILLAWGTAANSQSILPAGQADEAVGNITAIEGVVNLYREGQLELELVKLADPMLAKDFYETKPKSKLKLLLHGESLLSLGENTRIKISDNILISAQGQHKTVVDVINGTVRARVGRMPTLTIPRLEIRTPTAVVTAQGTYFIVWVSETQYGPTGVVNIGESGKVMVDNIDSAIKGFVDLDQNEYTLIEEGKPPTQASRVDPKLLKDLLNRTEVDDQAAEQIPKGMEAPGSDVSMEKVLPVEAGKTSGDQPPMSGETASYPTTPPIPQQPNLRQTGGIGSTPVSVNLEFPK
jgi:hypothetical protein